MVFPAQMIGRRLELESVAAAAGMVRDDRRSGVVSVWGVAGIGKSTLLAAARGLLAADGFTVVDTALTSAETALGWAGLHRLVPDEVPGLDELPGPQRDALLGALGRTPAEAVDPGTVAAALAGVVTHAARTGPVAVVIDDLHWLDAATAAAVAFAVRTVTDHPVLSLVASRPLVPIPLDPARLAEPARTVRIELDGLSPAALHRLLSDSCGVTLRRPDLVHLHEVTGGNPLYAIEAGRQLAAGRTMREALLPPSLQATIAERLAASPEPTRRTLEVVALLATPTVETVAQALPHVEVEASLLEAEETGIVRVRGDRIDFTHPLLRTGVVDLLGGMRRRGLLHHLADIVTDPDEQALLLAESVPEPDASVAAAVEAAAERAAERGALLLASDRFRAAASRSPDGSDRARRLLRAADAAYLGGDPEGALEAADEAAALATDRDVRVAAGHRAVLALAETDELPRALARAEALLAEADGYPVGQVRALRTIARIHAFGDLPAASAAIARAQELATETGDEEVIAGVTVVAALIRQLRGRPVDVDEIATIARSAMSSAALSARSTLLELLTWTDRVDDAIALGEEQLVEAQELGSIDDMNGIRDQLADACFRAGRWDRAVELLRASLDADLLSPTRGPADCRPADLAQTLAAQGDQAEAEQLLGITLAREHFAPAIELQRAARAGFVHLAAGRWADAAAHLRVARCHAHVMGEEDLGCIPFRADLVEALVQLGELDEAAEVADEHTALAARSGLLRGRAESARGRGLVAGARGDHRRAVEELELALPVHECWPVPFEHGRTLLALGAALRRSGRRARAAERLDQAAELFERLGARPWLERVESERARLGTRRTPTDELTPTEERIAELVTSGRSNADVAAELCVSLRTVESNLTRIYRKLGVRSRTALGARLRRAP